MVDGDAPHSFRTDKDGGGALADIGSHIISMARHLVGDIESVSARTLTVHKNRPLRPGSAERVPVVVGESSQSVVSFANGAIGSIEANWVASGRKMDLSWEVTGTKGALVFSQERMNELWLFADDSAKERSGFRKIEAGPEHPPYGAFCPAPGHQLGFNDLKVIEVAELLSAFAQGGRCNPDFREAYEVQRVVSAMQASAGNGTTVKI
jgi:predicted dehydrogenase